MSIILKFPASEDYYMSSLLVWNFADEKATFARGRVLGHTGLPLYKSSFINMNTYTTRKRLTMIYTI